MAWEDRGDYEFLQNADMVLTNFHGLWAKVIGDRAVELGRFPIATFRPSVTAKAWGKTGARTAGGRSAVLFWAYPSAYQEVLSKAPLSFASPSSCYNFTTSVWLKNLQVPSFRISRIAKRGDFLTDDDAP